MTAVRRGAPTLPAASSSTIASRRDDGDQTTAAADHIPLLDLSTAQSDLAQQAANNNGSERKPPIVLSSLSQVFRLWQPATQRERNMIVPAGISCMFVLLLLVFLGDSSSSFALSSKNGPITTASSAAALKAALKLTPIQTQVVHRHGDRTPITPMEDAAYWSTFIPSDETIAAIGQRTKIIRQPNAKPHSAGGGDIFGRLTTVGLDQMKQLGIKLRADVERLMQYEDDGVGMKGLDHVDPSQWLRVASTDFSRTLQSVQGVLFGLLQEDPSKGMLRGKSNGSAASSSSSRQGAIVEVDARHTAKMIPDPQPRRYVGQAELERELMAGDKFTTREREMKPLAVRVTRQLYNNGIIGDAASRVSFGVGEDETAAGKAELPTDLGDSGENSANANDNANGNAKPLPWNQLAEILKCLESRGKLPKSISSADLEAVAEHNAWRWFALLGDDRLAPQAIKSLSKKMILNGAEAIESWKGGGDGVPLARSSSSPLLHIFSGHDATLIALMCAFRIERPAVWPEYGSYLKMELLRDEAGLCGTPGFDGCSVDNAKGKRPISMGKEQKYYVLFSLNGEALQSSFGVQDGSAGATGGNSRYFVPWHNVMEGLKSLERGLPLLAAS